MRLLFIRIIVVFLGDKFLYKDFLKDIMKKRIDYLAIPDSQGKLKKERKNRAIDEFKRRYVNKIIILKGKDSEEDILYLGKILKKGEKIGIVTFPLHFEEYKEIIKKAKKEGKFPKGIKIENIKTPQNLKTSIYGSLGLWEEKLKHEKVKYVKYRHDKIWRKLKNFVKKIIR